MWNKLARLKDLFTGVHKRFYCNARGTRRFPILWRFERQSACYNGDPRHAIKLINIFFTLLLFQCLLISFKWFTYKDISANPNFLFFFTFGQFFFFFLFFFVVVFKRKKRREKIMEKVLFLLCDAKFLSFSFFILFLLQIETKLGMCVFFLHPTAR